MGKTKKLGQLNRFTCQLMSAKSPIISVWLTISLIIQSTTVQTAPAPAGAATGGAATAQKGAEESVSNVKTGDLCNANPKAADPSSEGGAQGGSDDSAFSVP